MPPPHVRVHGVYCDHSLRTQLITVGHTPSVHDCNLGICDCVFVLPQPVSTANHPYILSILKLSLVVFVFDCPIHMCSCTVSIRSIVNTNIVLAHNSTQNTFLLQFVMMPHMHFHRFVL